MRQYIVLAISFAVGVVSFWALHSMKVKDTTKSKKARNNKG